MTSVSTVAERKAELAGNLGRLRERIAVACDGAGRSPSEVTVVAVTKTFPVADIALLAELGVTDIGENRDQEAAVKAAWCAARGLKITWHFVGQLQLNKAARVARYADYVHSVDRTRLISVLGSRARTVGRQIGCLVQVSLDEPATPTPTTTGPGVLSPHAPDLPGSVPPVGRGGAAPALAVDLAQAIAAEAALRLCGVMAIAPAGSAGPAARRAFARLRELAEVIRAQHPDATMISAGMSGDLAEAIAEGATHLRIGTALLGGRPPFVG